MVRKSNQLPALGYTDTYSSWGCNAVYHDCNT